MKKSLAIAWNLLLLVFVALVASFIVPKVMGQFQSLDRLGEGSLRDRTMMMGFQGIGLMMFIAATAFSLSSLFWNSVSWGWRGLFIAMAAACAAGTVIAIRVDQADMGFVTYGDYIVFVGAAVLVAFPIVFFGTGYPSLLLGMIRGLRRQEIKPKQ